MILPSSKAVVHIDYNPRFDSHEDHVTVMEGQDAILPCTVKNLGKLKVIWQDSNFVPLTYSDRRVVDDWRYSIERGSLEDWNLGIKNTRWSDSGRYVCAVNSKPIRSKAVLLVVKVSASIINSSTKTNQTHKEGSDVTLVCKTAGNPKPHVTWKRLPAESYDLFPAPLDNSGCTFIGANPLANESSVDGSIIGMGEVLTIINISRNCGGVYECRASNEIPPPVDKLFNIAVEFGKETILQCYITAYPHAVTFWEKEGAVLRNSPNYQTDAYPDSVTFSLTLSLRILIREKSDFGTYECVAANSLGSDRGAVVLEDDIHLHSINKLEINESNASNASKLTKNSKLGMTSPRNQTLNRDATYKKLTASVVPTLKKDFLYNNNNHNSKYDLGCFICLKKIIAREMTFNQTFLAVADWLNEIFNGRQFEAFEKNDYTINYLHDLMVRNKMADENMQAVIEFHHNNISFYQNEKKRLENILERINIQEPDLQQETLRKLATLSSVANILNKDLESHCKVEDHDLKRKSEKAKFFHQKLSGYDKTIRRLKSELTDAELSSSLYHSALVQKSKDLQAKRDELNAVKQKLNAFHSLSPDSKLAKVELEEAKRELIIAREMTFNQTFLAVADWLNEIFNGRQFEAFEKNDYTINYLHDLMVRNKMADENMQAVIEFHHNNISFYQNEKKRLENILERINIQEPDLQQETLRKLATLSSVANILNVENPDNSRQE
ncbi:hypothetical protein HELRODRAFT_190578 [Helobdella robusta]|uniref:Ig-like domain-containing protein n=1 Tax=Helobdella robusta TaxID=6412 RepID=T1FS41_HELRO|nr:hypothetical protein HELRODRAFT_190578 [Helobdella robusta]ESO08726.1 hypothetical protein HELRODRAFT_190578 [Helobdella robusta]